MAKKNPSLQLNAGRDLLRWRGPDLNQRPLGYEPFAGRILQIAVSHKIFFQHALAVLLRVLGIPKDPWNALRLLAIRLHLQGRGLPGSHTEGLSVQGIPALVSALGAMDLPRGLSVGPTHLSILLEPNRQPIGADLITEW